MTEPVKIIPSYKDVPAGYDPGTAMVYSFVDESGKQIGQFVTCKGYINNVLSSSINKKDDPGWMYEKKYGKVSLDSTRILIARGHITSEEFEKEVNLAIDCVNSLETELGLVRSKSYPTTGVPVRQARLIVGSKRWMLSPTLINLYIFLLRNGKQHTMGNDYDDVVEQISETQKTVNHIVKNKYWKVFGKEILKNWPAGLDSSLVNQNGCQAFASPTYQVYLKKHFPHWKLIDQIATLGDSSAT